MRPTVGRSVHYQSYGTPNGEYLPEPRAAVITEAQYMGEGEPTPSEVAYRVSICVLNPEGMFFNRGVPFAETPTPGHWNWPPRVAE